MKNDAIRYINKPRYYQPLTPVVTSNDEISYNIDHKIEKIQKGMIFENDHIHLNWCEIYVLVNGNISFAVDNHIYPVTPGDIILSRPGVSHHCIYGNEGNVECYCMWFEASSSLRQKLDFLTEKDDSVANLLSLPNGVKAELLELMDQLYEYRISGCHNGLSAISNLFEILDLVNKYRVKSVSANKVPANFQNIINYVEENYIYPITIDSISKYFYINRTTLARWFKIYMDTTPTKYIESKRFSHSIELLKQGYSVQHAANKSGFSDYSHYISDFKKKFGITPYKYAQTLKKNE